MRILNLLKLFVTIRCFSVKRDTLSAKIVLNREISKRTARPIILEIQKNRCLMCNQKFNRMVPHEMHHVDHNSNNDTLYNFAALCSNCHAAHHRYNIKFPYKRHQKMFFKPDKK